MWRLSGSRFRVYPHRAALFSFFIRGRGGERSTSGFYSLEISRSLKSSYNSYINFLRHGTAASVRNTAFGIKLARDIYNDLFKDCLERLKRLPGGELLKNQRSPNDAGLRSRERK